MRHITQVLALAAVTTALAPGLHAASFPTITCAPDATLECTSSNGAWGVVTATVTDADGDALLAVWTINGNPVLTNVVASGVTTNGVALSITNQFGLGTNDVSIGVTDDGTNVFTCSTTIVVVDTTPPVIEVVAANPSVLWPPNHKMRPVDVRVRAYDTCGPVRWRIVDISSNEPVDGLGDGSTSPDWAIVAPHKAMVRAERAGPGNGRIYTLIVRAWDAAGNSTRGSVKVYVPHDRGHGQTYCDPSDWDDDNDDGSYNNGGGGQGKGKGKAKGQSNGKGKGKHK